MKSKEQKKAFYEKLRRLPANSKSMKNAWKAILQECNGDLPFFLSAKSIVDGKAQFIKGIRIGKGQTVSKGKTKSKKKGATKHNHKSNSLDKWSKRKQREKERNAEF